MNSINAIAFYSPLYSNQSAKLNAYSENQAPVEKSSSKDTVTLSQEGLNAASKWKEIASKYDVTNISANEKARMGQELYDSGLISIEEQMALCEPASIYDTGDLKFNALETAELDLYNMKKYGNNSMEAIKKQEKMYEILSNLASQRR